MQLSDFDELQLRSGRPNFILEYFVHAKTRQFAPFLD